MSGNAEVKTPELPLVREEFGFHRSVCGCEYCKAYCRHIPGSLIPADLARLCPPGHDLLTWAEQHLRALLDKPAPTLVPVRQENGHCHWHFDGKCAVHENAPFSCAFFDFHMSDAEAKERQEAALKARLDDVAARGPNYKVWLHLRQKGLIARSGDRSALTHDMQKMQRNAERSQRRSGFLS